MKPHEHLFQLQGEENNGRGVTCVRAICVWMEHGDLHSAQLVFHNDFDKIRSYPALVTWLNEFFQTNLS